MKNVKLFLSALVLVTATVVTAQQKPVLEKEGKRIKVTYFNDDNTISETGYFLNGKSDGKWIKYDKAGNEVTVAYYNQGKKEGTWLVWHDNGTVLYELQYDNNKLVNADRWKIDEKNMLANN